MDAQLWTRSASRRREGWRANFNVVVRGSLQRYPDKASVTMARKPR
ncbi:MAG: hypothetical protein QY306_05330 [Anaerolineales bacterium]|nr:MAG: hypothetical protein QY306_05330 [Anaerolineales bacterium]